MSQMKIVSVFVDEAGSHGNPVGIIIDEKLTLSNERRQLLTLESGLSEVVFINNLQKREISIFCPDNEIAFAGHAVVGTTFFLSHEYKQTITQLTGIKGVINTWQDADLTWVRGELSILPAWQFEKYESVKQIDELNPKKMASKKHLVVWTWIDETKGLIRARTFAPDWGIPEDEANGSGAMKLASDLNREITIVHGKGSVIYAKPDGVGCAAVGGRVNF